MKKYLKIVAGILLLALIVGMTYIVYDHSKTKKELSRAQANNKAITERYEDQKNYEYQLVLTIAEYENSNDSLIQRLQATQRELGIKSKELKEAQSLNTEIVRVDTLVLKDTVFIKDLYIDTTLGDKYLSNRLILEYPNSIKINTVARSEKDVFITQTRETINPPKKYWICRIFQKKHDVIRVDVKEHNPYIINEENVFIQFIED